MEVVMKNLGPVGAFVGACLSIWGANKLLQAFWQNETAMLVLTYLGGFFLWLFVIVLGGVIGHNLIKWFKIIRLTDE